MFHFLLIVRSGHPVAQWLRASSEWSGFESRWFCRSDLYLQMLPYQYLTTSVAVVLVVR